MTYRDSIFKEIDAERDYQDKNWGGAAHDDQHTIRDWASFILVYLGRACGEEGNWGLQTVDYGKVLDFQRKMLLKVATLAVAAIEANDRIDGGGG